MLIAIVDDTPEIVEMLETLLQLAGYATVSTTASARIPWLLRHQPDLLLLDLRIEHHEAGWEILAAIRADPITHQLPVIVCSAERDLVAAVARRNDSRLIAVTKPFLPATLLTAIQKFLPIASSE